jgi:hypothetical protein
MRACLSALSALSALYGPRGSQALIPHLGKVLPENAQADSGVAGSKGSSRSSTHIINKLARRGTPAVSRPAVEHAITFASDHFFREFTSAQQRLAATQERRLRKQEILDDITRAT